MVAEGVTDANELADLIKKKTGIESRVSVLGYIQRGGQPSAKDRMYGSLMGAYAVEILVNGNKNRIVAIKDDKLIDYSINEALNIQNSQIDSFQYKLSLLLSDWFISVQIKFIVIRLDSQIRQINLLITKMRSVN